MAYIHTYVLHATCVLKISGHVKGGWCRNISEKPGAEAMQEFGGKFSISNGNSFTVQNSTFLHNSSKSEFW